MLRHSCGYYLADKATDLRIMQDYLGHRDPDIRSATHGWLAVASKDCGNNRRGPSPMARPRRAACPPRPLPRGVRGVTPGQGQTCAASVNWLLREGANALSWLAPLGSGSGA